MCAIMFAGACNPSARNPDQSSTAQSDTVDAKDSTHSPSIQHGAGDSGKLYDSIITHPDLLLADEKPTASARMLSEADKIYIDWIIPDYPDVILLHEGSAETLNYVEQVHQYLRLKNANVRKKAIVQKHKHTARDKKLYIDDVGENWYEVYVFDEWK